MKKILTPFLYLSLILFSLQSKAQPTEKYLVGYGKSDITYLEDDGFGLFGYGNYHQRVVGEEAFTSRIYSRVMSIKDPNTGRQIIYLHADLGGIFHPMRKGLIEKIKSELLPDFDESSLIMTASHTHCAYSGLSHYALYMASAPGYYPQVIEFMVDRMYESVQQSLESQALSTLFIKEGEFEPETPVAFNRGLKAYNKNKDRKRKYDRCETNLALNRNMPMLSVLDENGASRGFINWFGVHPIEVREDHNFIDGASKGYAASEAEAKMRPNDIAIFAQSGAGDVMTSDFHNHKLFEEEMKVILEDPSYDHNKTSLKQARWNGQVQAEKALEIRAGKTGYQVQGGIDHELIYIDFSELEVDPEFSNGCKNARTSSPCLGAPFLTGSHYWKDGAKGRGLLNFFSGFARTIFRIRAPFIKAQKRKYRKQLYKSQSPKRIVLDGTEKSVFGLEFKNYKKKGFTKFFINIMSKEIIIKEIIRELELGALEEHSLLPKILPIQIVRIGNIAIAGLPTEITTIAHNRLQRTLLEILKKDGIAEVFISSYANEYAGYTTTFEEYKMQRYEAGHTLFGKHQLGAVQTAFKHLAKEFAKPRVERNLDRELRPPVFSKEELDKRSNLEPLERD